MKHQLEKYIGQVVEIIYSDKQKGFTQRRVKLLKVEGGTAKAFCLERQAPRSFLVNSILAVEKSAGMSLRRRTS